MDQYLEFLSLSDPKNILPMLRKTPALWQLFPWAQHGVRLGPGVGLERGWRGVAHEAWGGGPRGTKHLVTSSAVRARGGLWNREYPSLWKAW